MAGIGEAQGDTRLVRVQRMTRMQHDNVSYFDRQDRHFQDFVVVHE
jgi:hypothetical protein